MGGSAIKGQNSKEEITKKTGQNIREMRLEATILQEQSGFYTLSLPLIFFLDIQSIQQIQHILPYNTSFSEDGTSLLQQDCSVCCTPELLEATG